MNKINWGIFETGSEWEHFMHLLLEYQYGDKILTSDRPGKDLGIDAISKDLTIAYQAKFHQKVSMDIVINDSLSELKKIKEFKKQNDNLWNKVKKWILFTNIKVNTNDNEKWNKKVVIKFNEIGIEATYLHLSQIEAELIKHPYLLKHFFEKTNLIFQSFNQEKNRLNRVNYYNNSLNIPFVGREKELINASEFINNNKQKFLIVTGSRGIGKTRFLFEIAKNLPENWCPLWGTRNIINNEFSVNKLPLFQEFVIFLDETIDYSLFSKLKSLAELDTFKNWKIIITEENKNSQIVKELKNKDFKEFVAPIIELKPLKKEDAKSIFNNFLDTFPVKDKKDAIFNLDNASKRIPLWINICFKLLTETGSLSGLENYPEDVVNSFSNKVLKEIIENQGEQKKLWEVLSWLALFGKIKIKGKEKNEVAEFIINQTKIEKDDFYKIVEVIENFGLLQRKGAYDKTLALEPDTLRDFILEEVLIIKATGEFTPFGEKIITLLSDREAIIPEIETVLLNLSRIEFYSEMKINILDKFIDSLIEVAKNSHAYIQDHIITISENFSFIRPSDAIRLYKAILYNPGETFHFEHYDLEFSHLDAIKNIPWQAFTIAKYAESLSRQKEIYDFFIELIEYEENKNLKMGEKNGQGAKALFSRTLFGEYWSYKYYSFIIKKLKEIFKKIQKPQELRTSEIIAFKFLFGGVLSCERFVMGPSYDYQFSYYTYFITPNRKTEWENRESFLNLGKKFIEQNNSDNKIFDIILEIYSDSFISVNRIILPPDNPKHPELIDVINNYFKEELKWVIWVLKNKNLNKDQKHVIRETWDWHYKFTKDQEIKNLTQECENLYFDSDDLELIKNLFDHKNKENREKSEQYFINKLLNSKTIDEIFEFIKNIQLFRGNNSISFSIIKIIFEFAEKCPNEDYILSFVSACIKKPEDDEHYKIGCLCLTGLLRKYRANNENQEALTLITKMQKETNDPKMLVISLYDHARFYGAGNLTLEDFNFCITELENFKDFDKKVPIIANFAIVFWDLVKSYIETNWINFSSEEKSKILSEIISQFSGIKLWSEKSGEKLSEDKINWIMTKVLELDDIDKMSASDYELENLIGEDKFSLKWLVEKLKSRIKVCEETKNFNVFPNFINLENFVDTDYDKPENVNALTELLDFVEKEGYISYLLVKFVVNLDPLGNVLGELVAQKIENAEENKIDDYSIIGGHYRYNSPGWEIISKAACLKIEEFPHKKDEILNSLTWHGVFNRSANSRYEISQYLINELEEAKTNLSQSDYLRKEFWEMVVNNLQKEMEWETQQIKERRGE